MEWNDIQRVLVVVAHPDDAEFGSSGTIAKLTAEGKTVCYAVVTDGSKGSSDPEMTPDRLVKLRAAEQRAAADVLRVHTVDFLGFPDGMLEPTLEVRKAIAGAIRRHRPDVVICQNPSRDLSLSVFAQHPDHLAAAEATIAAIYPCARDRMTFPELLEQGLEPHIVREVWVGGTSTPDLFIDISSTLDTKIEALLAHSSQVDETVREWLPQRARQIGEPQGIEYAEGFRRIEIP